MKKQNLLLMLSIALILAFCPLQLNAYGAAPPKTATISSINGLDKALADSYTAKSETLVVSIKNYDTKTYDVRTAIIRILDKYPKNDYIISEYTVTTARSGISAKLTINLKYTKADTSVDSSTAFLDALKKAAQQGKSTYRIKISKYNEKSYSLADLSAKLQDNYADLYFINSAGSKWIAVKGANTGIAEITLKYNYSKQEIATMQKTLDDKINKIIAAAVPPNATKIDMELMLHDYVIKNVQSKVLSSNNPASMDNTAYGALVSGAANDIGYARAMQMLLERVGIHCIVVHGSGRTWNMVEIDGSYYHLNAFHDKLEEKGEQTIYTHDYFNLSDAEMAKSFQWDKSKYPHCNSTKAGFFYMNKTFASDKSAFLRIIRDGVDNVRPTISVKMANFNSEVYGVSEAIESICKDYPDLDYVKSWRWFTNSKQGIYNIALTFDRPIEELLAMKTAVNQKADEIIHNIILPGMSEYEKELAIHDYIIQNAKYDKTNADKMATDREAVPLEEHDAYGVMIKGLGVCDSYAEAMKILLNKAGVECMVVLGDMKDNTTNIGHAWNIVRIDGKYYQLDATWDDVELEDGSEFTSHAFFNLTDEDMAKDHIWDAKTYPACTNTDANYFVKNNTVASSYESAYNIIQQGMANGQTVVCLRISSYDPVSYDIRGLIQRAVDSTSYHRAKSASWITDKDLGVVEITFEY